MIQHTKESGGMEDPTTASASASTSTTSQTSSSSINHRKVSKKKEAVCLALPENYYNPNSPVGKSRQLERYLNYLLEHPALSTSLSLNTILKVGCAPRQRQILLSEFALTQFYFFGFVLNRQANQESRLQNSAEQMYTSFKGV
jgi:hypothetical protein